MAVLAARRATLASWPQATDDSVAGIAEVQRLGGHTVGWGEQPEPHGELVTVRDGKVTEMVAYPNVDEALVAAGLSVPDDPHK